MCDPYHPHPQPAPAPAPSGRPIYFTRAELEGLVPPQFILQALDDDGDGVEDAGAFDTLCAGACNDVDAICSTLFTTPFAAPVPVLISQAALTFAAKQLYQRRGIESQKNPYASKATQATEKLTRIVQKEEAVPTDFPLGIASVSANLERAKSVSQNPFLCA